MKTITDSYLKNIKAGERPREIRVEERVFLHVTMRKGKTVKKWFLRYTDAAGNDQRLIFGEYPEMGFAEARRMAEKLAKDAKSGTTLAAARKNAAEPRASQSFGNLADEWMA